MRITLGDKTMLHLTGSGKINIGLNYLSPGMIKALLYNYDVDGDIVKPEHMVFLKSKVVPLLQNNRGHIWMQGSTSKSGTNIHNMKLSRRRVNNIASFLRTQGISDLQMQLNAVGEEQAQAHTLEDELDRAVNLVVIPVARDSPPPPKKIPPPPPVNTNFKIRMLAGLTVSLGVYQVENLFFQIADVRNRLTAFYTYTSAGFGKGLIPGSPLSATMKGPWNNFQTTSAIRVSQFEGAARFTTIGTGRWTSNYLSMMGLPKGISAIPVSLKINTGFTIGIGGSTSGGKMIWVPSEEMIYNGD